jgi:hypothetical protein
MLGMCCLVLAGPRERLSWRLRCVQTKLDTSRLALGAKSDLLTSSTKILCRGTAAHPRLAGHPPRFCIVGNTFAHSLHADVYAGGNHHGRANSIALRLLLRRTSR